MAKYDRREQPPCLEFPAHDEPKPMSYLPRDADRENILMANGAANKIIKASHT